MSKILIVEDNLAQAESLALILEARGHDVLVAGGTHQAQQQVLTHGTEPIHGIEAVVLDLRIPQTGGKAFLEWLRDREETRSVPVVITTGLPLDEATELKGQANVRLLRKPFLMQELVARFAEMGVAL